jgi:glycosyltransferase involved in cell wall biosynthesis
MMKILLINKFFFSFGGTETAFFQTAKLLQDLGHEVIYFSMAHPKNKESRYSRHFVSRVDFGEMRGWQEKIRGVKRILFGSESRAKLDELLRVEKPDIAHLHNIYHHLSPAIIGTLKKHKIPVVMTLHDYKTVCPAYKLFSRGKICEKCRGAHFFWCFLNRCVKNSYLKSLVGSLEMSLHRNYYHQVDRFIAPSLFLIGKIKEMGFSGNCTCIANFTDCSPMAAMPAPSAAQIIFFGRLVEEKGVSLLIEAMKGIAADCLIIGDGPQKEELQGLAARTSDARIQFLPRQPFSLLVPIVRRATMVVIPSIWYENNPFSIIESFSLGVPVVAASIGGIPELVIDRETGLLFTAGDSVDLRAKINKLLACPDLGRELAKKAFLHLEQHFSPMQHGEKLQHLYQELLEASAASQMIDRQ